MNIRIRRIIALIFILAFLIAAPSLLFYTAGYRYNFKKSEVQKTGALIIKTEPHGAGVSLNEQLMSSATPLRLNNILPDEYTVTVQKEDYYPWVKKLLIKPQESTFAEDIILFLRAEPKKIIDQNIVWLNFSPAHKYALYLTDEKNNQNLYVLNLNNSKTKPIPLATKLDSNLQTIWSNDASNAIVADKGWTYIITTYFSPQITDISSRVAKEHLTNFKWAENNSNILFAQSDNQIHQINLITNTSEPIFKLAGAESLIDYLVTGEEIFIIEKLAAKTIITKYPLGLDKQPELNQSIELKNEHFRLAAHYQNLLGLTTDDTGSLYLINLSLDKIAFYKDGVRGLDLDSANHYLLIETEQELSYIDLTQSELREENITRYSQGLRSAFWHSESENYVFSLHEGKVEIIELDNRDHRFTISLPIDNATTLNSDNNSEKLFFLKDQSLYELNIQ